MLRVILILSIFISSVSLRANHLETKTPQQRTLKISGFIQDEKKNKLGDVKINISLITAANHTSIKSEALSKADGSYNFDLKEAGEMTVEFTKKGYLPYTLVINISKADYLQLRIDGTPFKQQVLMPVKSAIMPIDIYNGSIIKFNSPERTFEGIPYRRFKQAHQIKFTKGAKSNEKLIKSISSDLKDGNLKDFLALIASHQEIKTVIENTINAKDKEKWSIFFRMDETNGLTARLENHQDAFAAITKLLGDKSNAYNITSFDINEKQSKIIDETKTHFVTYTATLKNKKSELKKFDFYFVNTINGWKMHGFIAENYQR